VDLNESEWGPTHIYAVEHKSCFASKSQKRNFSFQQPKKKITDSIANVVPANKTSIGTNSHSPKKNNNKNTEIYKQTKIEDEIG